MSVITELLVMTSINEDDAIARLNQWCHDNDEHRHQQFAQLDTDAAGGNKVFGGQVWAMCANHFLPLEALIAAFPTFGWQLPKQAVLLVDYEHDEEVRVVRADGLKLGGFADLEWRD